MSGQDWKRLLPEANLAHYHTTALFCHNITCLDEGTTQCLWWLISSFFFWPRTFFSFSACVMSSKFEDA